MAPKQNVFSDITAAQVMVDSPSTFMSDGLAEAGVTMSDMNRGFVAETFAEEGRVDADETNYVGDPYSTDGGLIPRNNRYQRL